MPGIPYKISIKGCVTAVSTFKKRKFVTPQNWIFWAAFVLTKMTGINFLNKNVCRFAENKGN